ncbi:MAG: phage holin family protein [Cyclobacteriaceae bacterium]|nr:phage holin family protein [Cyclobacteriaceae bacterium]
MFKNIVSTLINFIETKLEIYKIQLKEEAAKLFTLIVLIILFGLIGLLFILFISFFIAEIINSLLVHQYFGYLIVAGVYIILGVITYYMRGRIREGITNTIFSEEVENDE